LRPFFHRIANQNHGVDFLPLLAHSREVIGKSDRGNVEGRDFMRHLFGNKAGVPSGERSGRGSDRIPAIAYVFMMDRFLTIDNGRYAAFAATVARTENSAFPFKAAADRSRPG
jgi:hypothetical protein